MVVGTKLAAWSLRLHKRPSRGGPRWNSRSLRRKQASERTWRQDLQTSAARSRLAGSKGGRRRRISSTRSSTSVTAAAAMLALRARIGS
ncbi:hypothetical protein HU200_027919 [Digitaria exilis]|uniref:Uncharacterized protein n=1 Tax=Digitaria exilis TaxID=1010633 RepID=A0A835BSK0_9POAL|nr:hypothetical protein HU200_027919 [Digitaria exilis]